MALEDILWGIAGYISFFIFQLTQPARQRSGWDFFLQVAFFSLLCFVFARIIISLGLFIFPNLKNFSTVWHQDKYYFHSFTLIIGIIIAAPTIGFVLSLPYLKNKWHKILSTILKIHGKKRDFEFTDLFFAYLHRNLNELMITLKNIKVYIGILIAATEDPNESSQYIQITPITRGYRDKDTHQLVLNINYIEDAERPESAPDIDILIPSTEITTLTKFNSDLHQEFIKLGLTKVINSNQ